MTVQKKCSEETMDRMVKAYKNTERFLFLCSFREAREPSGWGVVVLKTLGGLALMA